MRVEQGARLTLDIEKPAVGGRMIARYERQIVLVDGAIPGERVVGQIERVGKGVAFARTVDVLSPSADRRAAADRQCGGNVFAHVAYPRQLQLKAEIITDAFARIGRLPLGVPPAVTGSPERGYRMRGRLHVRGQRLGFFREGSHDLCDAAGTGQLLPATEAWIAAASALLQRDGRAGLTGVEIAENVSGDQRVCHLELEAGVDAQAFGPLAAGLTGLSARRDGDRESIVLAGTPLVTDVLHARDADPGSALRIRRDVRAFFQGNRFLLEPLVRHVLSLVPDGPVIDLYAGVGLFGLSLAAAGVEDVTLVEGDPVSGADLGENAEPFMGRVRVERTSVEAFLTIGGTLAADGGGAGSGLATIIVDPPRTGLSRLALAGILARRPRRVVYVSCDVATLARDARVMVDSGYAVTAVTGMDLFPNTAHVETIVALDRE